RQACDDEARTVLVRLGRELPLTEVEPLRLETAAGTRIRALALRHAGLAEKQAAARRRLEGARVRRDEKRARLAALAAPDAALEPLARAVAAASPERDLMARLRSQATELEAK